MWYFEEGDLTVNELRRLIRQLDPETPMHLQMSDELAEGAGYGKAWYSSQQEHWDGWLREYRGSGAYNRQVRGDRDARFVYNHGQCAPMLFWLAEAAGVDQGVLKNAYLAVTVAPSRNSSQCGALRKTIPWETLEPLLLKLRKPSYVGLLVNSVMKAMR